MAMGGCSSAVVHLRGILLCEFVPLTLALITCVFIIFSELLLMTSTHHPYSSSSSSGIASSQSQPQPQHSFTINHDLLVFKPADRHHNHLVGTAALVEYRDKQQQQQQQQGRFYNISSSSSDVRVVASAGSNSTGETKESSSSSRRRSAAPPPITTATVLQRTGDASQSQWSQGILFQHAGENVDNTRDVFHDRALFLEEYKEMNKSMKIFVYPHNRNHPFANVLLPLKDDDQQPGGNYASESYFKRSLFKSHFITKNPSEAHLFFLPFSIAGLRHDRRVGVGGIQEFVRSYVQNITRDYPYWNRTGGADHFYVACHSVGRSAMDKAVHVKLNAIQVVCSSSYFLPGYVSHKDASIPQIWPRNENPHPYRSPAKRKKLAFYAGAMNSRVRKFLVEEYGNDSEMSIHRSRLKTPYSELLLSSKFCIHAKGFEVNTARIGDALFYGCVPVILADHYDLPYADVLNWNSFSVVVSTMDIPKLKKMLQEMVISSGGGDYNKYLRLQEHVMEVQKHFQWNKLPIDYDAFHMVMYELWIRRSHVRVTN